MGSPTVPRSLSDARDVRVTAAVDSDDEELTTDAGQEPLDNLDRIAEALDAHGTPTPLADKLLEAASILAIDDELHLGFNDQLYEQLFG